MTVRRDNIGTGRTFPKGSVFQNDSYFGTDNKFTQATFGDRCEIGDLCEINGGAFGRECLFSCSVKFSGDVKLGEGCEISAHSVVYGKISIDNYAIFNSVRIRNIYGFHFCTPEYNAYVTLATTDNGIVFEHDGVFDYSEEFHKLKSKTIPLPVFRSLVTMVEDL